MSSARLLFGIGPLRYSLFQLYRVPVARWGDYVRDDPAHKNRMRSLSPAPVRRIATDKAMFYGHCVRRELPTIPIFCVVSRGLQTPYQWTLHVRDLESWHSVLSGIHADLFVKPVDGTFSEDAFLVTRTAGGARFVGRDSSLDTVFEQIWSGLDRRSAFIVQPRIANHRGMHRYASDSCLSTIRAVTCMDGTSPRLLFAAIKLPVTPNTDDDFRHGMKGNLCATVDLNNGTIGVPKGSRTRDWPDITEVPCHPDSGEPIAGQTVPMWSEVVALALEAQSSLPELRSIGWDIAVTDQGPLLVEANSTYGMAMMQVAYGRGLKPDLYDALGLPR
jgi:hypothetical protein